MLSRRDFIQPPHKFDPADTPAGAKAACSRCLTDVFNPALHSSLVSSAKEYPSVSRHYSCLASDIYVSMHEGCRWCTSIGNALLTSADLDYWMDDWEGSQSSDEEVPSSDGSSASQNSVTNDGDRSSSLGKPGFITIRALDCSARLDVVIEFVKWDDSPVFNLVDVTVNVFQTSKGDMTLPVMKNEEAVRIRFEVLSPGDIFPGIFGRVWGVVSAASNDWAAQAEVWMKTCRGHAGCRSTGDFQPTRVIDVRNPQHLRLVTRDDATPPRPYSALSYVWGPSQPYVLTKKTINQMHVGLDSSKLPKTITDAVSVARRMGFAYLWVDALCIIQDSPEDKLKELPSMSDIYRQSSLTIVAASSSSASEGFLRSPQPSTFFVEPFQININTEEGRSASMIFGYRNTYKAMVDPINSRAWTLQERVLSSHQLIFSNKGVMWICRECSINPSAPPDSGPPFDTSLDPDTSGNEVDEKRLCEQWMCIRADYTAMDMSYCRDKLPAISALAAEISRRSGWTYLAGLWKENLFSELHWRSLKSMPDGETFLLKPQKAREAGYLAPSWSWASHGLGMISDAEDERMDREVFHFKVLDCQVEAVDNANFHFGPVKSGFLLVEGKMIELVLKLQDSRDPIGSDAALITIEEDEYGRTQTVGNGTLDPLDDDLQPDTRVFCLGMSTLRLGRQRIVPVEGLLLFSTAQRGTFRRVGLFSMTAPSVFDNVPPRVLRIE